MAVSLNNKRNTAIVDTTGKLSLIHHGHNTCTYDRIGNTIELSLCGWDTVTTRGKLNAFSSKYGLGFGVYRDKGETYLRMSSYANDIKKLDAYERITFGR